MKNKKIYSYLLIAASLLTFSGCEERSKDNIITDVNQIRTFVMRYFEREGFIEDDSNKNYNIKFNADATLGQDYPKQSHTVTDVDNCNVTYYYDDDENQILYYKNNYVSHADKYSDSETLSQNTRYQIDAQKKNRGGLRFDQKYSYENWQFAQDNSYCSYIEYLWPHSEEVMKFAQTYEFEDGEKAKLANNIQRNGMLANLLQFESIILGLEKLDFMSYRKTDELRYISGELSTAMTLRVTSEGNFSVSYLYQYDNYTMRYSPETFEEDEEEYTGDVTCNGYISGKFTVQNYVCTEMTFDSAYTTECIDINTSDNLVTYHLLDIVEQHVTSELDTDIKGMTTVPEDWANYIEEEEDE